MMLPKRKQMHLTDFDYSNKDMVYFLTLCTYGNQSYFKDPKAAQQIAYEIDYRAHVAKEVEVFVYCIMPDHLHLLMKLKEGYGKTLHNWVAAFKRYSARIFSEMYKIKPLWQTNFYEHIVRKDESVNKIAEYIVNNPVRKNIVSDWQRYCFSQIDYDAFK